MDLGEVSSDALLSEDGLYRYWLSRSWAEGGRVSFIMLNLNPSLGWRRLCRMESYAQFKKFDEERQLVYAEVYAPMIPDSQGDFMTAEGIEKIAHDFMKNGNVNKIDTNHDLEENGSFVIESFIARGNDPDFTVGA